MRPDGCPDAPECDWLYFQWEHEQGWHADEYVDVCPICITRARMPEEKEKEVECD